VRYPRSLTLFEKYGIDYCCGGDATLSKAAEEKGVSLSNLLSELEELISAPPDPEAELEPDWSVASLGDLIDYIVSKHHLFMKQQLPRLGQMMEAVVVAHGNTHGDVLRPLRDRFLTLREAIEQHLRKEEEVLFPAVRQLSNGGGHDLSVLIRETVQEHETVGSILHAMRELTSAYETPADACPTYHGLYRGLAAIERDLHRHIHLENNVLFPRAAASEEKGEG